MVPPDWRHPKDSNGHHVPLHHSFAKVTQGWRDYVAGGGVCSLEDYCNPNPDDYMPDWPADVATHLCMYENTTEGTPISPAFATREELARWLADNSASWFGRNGASYETWLTIIERGCIGLLVSRDGASPALGAP